MGFIPTEVGAHGLYPSRDGTKLYVSNRGTHNLAGRKNGQAAYRWSASPPIRQLDIPGT